MASPSPRSDRTLFLLAIGMVLAVAVVIIAGLQILRGGTTDQAAGIGGPFMLTDQTGAQVTDQSYKGLYRLIYFGYTFCPDACPTQLQVMAQAVDDLGPAGKKIQPIFITVDPERDSVKQLSGYVPLFHPRLVGLTGTPMQIAQVAKEYKVYYAKADDPGSGTYLMNHSSFVYLMDPAGKFVTVFPHDMDAEKMAGEIRRYMNAS